MDNDFTEIGVLIADRLTFFRHGMIGMLRESRPTWCTTEAGTFEEVRNHLRGARPELALVDLQLPGLDGADGIRQLRLLFPEQSIVVLADSDSRATILECLAAGAQGYVLKSSSPMQFLRAIDTILSGGVFAPASLTGVPAQAPATQRAVAADIQMLPATLTDRQRDVLRLLAEGCATKTIARRLDLAVGTVKVHLAAIYRALGAHSRLEAMAKACGGIPLPPVLTAAVVIPVLERLH
jgi:DNA-binding NarL/FixJ family response regulator